MIVWDIVIWCCIGITIMALLFGITMQLMRPEEYIEMSKNRWNTRTPDDVRVGTLYVLPALVVTLELIRHML